jgi:glycyl-tRNA synthetase
MSKQIELVNVLKASGFIFQGSEIYDGLSNTWDYGPLGSILKNNIKKLWIKRFINQEHNAFLIDSSIILNPRVWEASGHTSTFSDPLIDCKNCKERYRADKLSEIVNLGLSEAEIKSELNIDVFNVKRIKCPKCEKIDWTNIRQFNLMYRTFQGPVENMENSVYLRPETAQGIFVNFKNIQRSMRAKLPFSVGQIGKSFRNEITPGNFIFRTREFEQMELEVFCFPEEDEATFNHYLKKIEFFLLNDMKISNENLRMKEHEKEELSHYAKKTIDFEYKFYHDWSELWGIANRTDFDLKSHESFSNKDLSYLDQEKNTKITPYVIEPSVGVDRLMYAFLTDKYRKQTLEDGEERIFFDFPYFLSPYKIAILPLSNKLSDISFEIYMNLKKNNIECTYDSSGSIGKRYRRQDAIGTYLCITIDFDTEKDNTVTVRNRNTMEQERVNIDEIINNYIMWSKKYE